MPNRMPITSARAIATRALLPVAIIFAIRMLVKAMMEPTERSMPPVRITSAVPITAMPR